MLKSTDRTSSELFERIQRRLQATGKTAKAASREAGLSESFIKNIKTGASKSPRAEGIASLARTLGTTVEWLTEGRGPEDSGDRVSWHGEPSTVRPVAIEPVEQTRIIGKAKAGEFIAIEDLGDWDEQRFIDDAPDPRFPNARRLAFEVEGDSMNALKPIAIPDGATVSALALEDIQDRMPLRDGMIVVVERTRHGGLEREWSIKQIEIYENRIEFHPRSTNPRHKPIVVERDYEADDGTKVTIIAVVRRLVATFF